MEDKGRDKDNNEDDDSLTFMSKHKYVYSLGLRLDDASKSRVMSVWGMNFLVDVICVSRGVFPKDVNKRFVLWSLT